jgi:hypothetical protein
MTGMAHVGDAVPAPIESERFDELLHRYALFVVALAAITIGSLLLVSPPGALAAYAPFALLAIGSGALATLVGLYSTRAWSGGPRTARERDRNPGSSRSAKPGTAPSVPARASRTLASTNRGSEWRVLSSPPDPGDETWISWLPRVHRRLGPEAAGYASGGSYSPGRPGSLVAVPLRKSGSGVSSPRPSTGQFVPSETASRIESPEPVRSFPRTTPGPASVSSTVGARAFSDEELDRMFPPVNDRDSLFLSEAPERVVGALRPRPATPHWGGAPSPQHEMKERESRTPETEEDRTPVSRSREADDRAPGNLFRDGSILEPRGATGSASSARGLGPDGLDLEAKNPVPPHLRGAGPLVRAQPSRAGQSSSAAIAKSVCASCSKVVVNLRMSGPCPRCLRPICNECLRSALATYGHGWCVDCLPAFNVSVT